MIDNRLAVAQQLSEISRIMEMVAEDLYDISGGTPQFTEDLKKALRKKHILLKQVWVMDKVEGGVRFFLNMRLEAGSVFPCGRLRRSYQKCVDVT